MTRGQDKKCPFIQKGGTISSNLVETESARKARAEEITEVLEMEHDDKVVSSTSLPPEIFSDIGENSDEYQGIALSSHPPDAESSG